MPSLSSAPLGRSGFGNDKRTSLNCLQSTLEKLKLDESRHENVAATLAQRLALTTNHAKNVSRSHTAGTFCESGYIWVKTIGEGRHGVVKLAKRKNRKDMSLGASSRRTDNPCSEFVAVKVIQRFTVRKGKLEHNEMMANKELHSTLMRQIKALREMEHPNIQRIYETFEDSQRIYIVMELYTGGDLLQRESTAIPEHRVAWIMCQICSAMVEAHDRGIVHQDLRPDNVLYRTREPGCGLVVTDWACTEYINTPPKDSRRQLIISEYSAPELAPEMRTDRSDVWSMGVIAFALLTLELPFGQHGPRPTSDADFEWRPEDKTLSRPCCEFISSILRRDPNLRPSARELLGHHWLVEARNVVTGSTPRLSKQTITSMMGFRRHSNLHRMTAAIAADYLSGAQLTELTKQFQSLDTDGDGKVLKGDLIRALQGVWEGGRILHDVADLQNDHPDIQQFVQDNDNLDVLVGLMDADGDGKISYSEFLAAAADSVLSDCSRLCWEAFNAFDLDKSGWISRKELEDLINSPAMAPVFQNTEVTRRQAGRGKTKELVAEAFADLGSETLSANAMFDHMNTDGDAKITFEEFLAAIISE